MEILLAFTAVALVMLKKRSLFVMILGRPPGGKSWSGTHQWSLFHGTPSKPTFTFTPVLFRHPHLLRVLVSQGRGSECVATVLNIQCTHLLHAEEAPLFHCELSSSIMKGSFNDIVRRFGVIGVYVWLIGLVWLSLALVFLFCFVLFTAVDDVVVWGFAGGIVVIFVFICLFGILRQGLSLEPWLSWNSLTTQVIILNTNCIFPASHKWFRSFVTLTSEV